MARLLSFLPPRWRICAMARDFVETVASSPTKLKIADLLSIRPRTLRELADLSGVSVQGVLRHLNELDKVGLLHQANIKGSKMSTRRLYSLKEVRVRDYTVGDLTIIKVTKQPRIVKGGGGHVSVESLGSEILVSRRRIKDKARRLARTIDELMEDERRLIQAIEDLQLEDEDRIVMQTVFTEDTLDDAERILSRIQGLPDARRSIDKALAEAKRNVR